MTETPTRSEKKSRARSPEEIQAEIQQTRARLTQNLERLKAEANPRALAARAQQALVAQFTNPETGQIRIERVAGVTVTVVGIVLIRRGVRSRARRRELERLRQVVWVPVPKFALSPELLAVARDAVELAPGPSVLVGASALPPVAELTALAGVPALPNGAGLAE